MGYRDDFYTVGNIIGYSGDLADSPTVYFVHGNEFGHITQRHPSPQNVGRTEVCAARNYTIANEMVGGQLRLLEKVNGNVIHASRSTLTAINPASVADADATALLARAIYTWSGEKYISQFTEDDFDKIDVAEAAKGRAMAELLRPPIGHLLRAP